MERTSLFQKFNLKETDKKKLPKAMQKTSLNEQESFIQEKIHRRNEIKRKMKSCEKRRQEFIKKDLEKRSISTKEGFSAEIYEIMEEQAKEKGLKVEESVMH